MSKLLNLGWKELKEKVDRLANGIFEYETPRIIVSQEELEISIISGNTYSGSFTIKNSNDTKIKGVLYSSNKLLELEQTRFTESLNTIQYQFNGRYMSPGDSVKGVVSIVSDCGELQIPFTANLEPPYSNSSMGKIKDLFQFANLAKADWSEALKIFKSEEFIPIFLLYEKKYIQLYENLLKSRSSSQAMEEFLIAVHKKLRINISVDKLLLNYQIEKEGFKDKLTLTKDNWGYTDIRVSTDSSFIELEHKLIWSDNFVGNTYPLEFIVNPEKLKPGNHCGRIYIKTVHQTIVVEVNCKCRNSEFTTDYNRRKIKDALIKIEKNYLDFRMNRISISKYVLENIELLDHVMALDEKKREEYQMLKAHLHIISDKDTLAKEILEPYKEKLEGISESGIISYCGYLYLEALLYKEEAYIETARIHIRDLYETSCDNWRLLWFLLYIDKRYDNNKGLKLEDIKKEYKKGCHSPALYFEAVTIFNEDPALLYELGSYELQVLHWGLKQDFLNKDAALQFTYLASKRKGFHRLVHECLGLIYEKYKLKDALSAICGLLIKGHQRSNIYFRWFKLGVEEQLRITELYEYYMYSMNEDEDMILPQPVLLYFIYNSNLHDRKKAFLYAYVIKNKEVNPAIYRTYLKQMEQFTLKQLASHNISSSLVVLYEEILIQEAITPEIAKELPFIMYKQEIYCNNPNIKGVFVAHKEMDSEVYAPFVNGTAQIDIYTESAELYLVDGYDNRYFTTIDYTLNKLMRPEEFANICVEWDVSHPMLLLNLSEKVQFYQKADIKYIELRKRVLQIPGLSKEYYKENILTLIDFYYDYYEGELLEAYLLEIDFKDLGKEERNKIIELCIIRDLYQKAMAGLKEYGFEGVALNRLIKLCSRVLQNIYHDGAYSSRNLDINQGNTMENWLISNKETEDVLGNLCYYIFQNGKYNEDILRYMVTHFYGTTEEMFNIWKAATAFEIDTLELEERILMQVLFSESYLVDTLSVFMDYYKKGYNHKIIRAFLSYSGYMYLIKDRFIQPELLPIMKRELTYEENDICLLALLKEYAKQDNLEGKDLEFAEINVLKFIKKGVILPFFKDFEKHFLLPAQLNNKFFIEYITDPRHKVNIHYQIEDQNNEEEFITETMPNIYMGIHVKEFIVFYNERVQYYITEENQDGQVNITESVEVKLGEDMELDEDTRFNHLNFMLMAMDMKDEKTMIESIESYIKKGYVISKIFKPL